MATFFDIPVQGISGTPDLLGPLRGKVVLAVNVASRCGLTPQYTGLESLQRELDDQNFSVVGFPCNQFGAQEPGAADEIAAFCESNYEVSFPVFGKIDVNGSSAHPLYRFLKKSKPGILGPFGGGAIKWNFTKCLVYKSGNVVGRYGSATKPESLTKRIEALLGRE